MPNSSPHSAQGERSPAPKLTFGTGSPKTKTEASAGQKSNGSPSSKNADKMGGADEMMMTNDGKSHNSIIVRKIADICRTEIGSI